MGEDRPGSGRRLLYVGCYTPSGGPGIRVFDASRPDGTLRALGAAGAVQDASYLAVGPGQGVLYAVSERTEPGSGEVVALSLDHATGALAELDRVTSAGAAPCHLAVSADGRHVYVANYVDGTVVAHRLDQHGRFGGLLARHQHAGSGPRADRQEGPHTHGVLPRHDRTVLVTDLGTDELLRYRHTGPDDDELLLDDALAMPPGTGPRHAVSHPRHDDVVLVVGELDASVTVVVDRPGEPLRVGARGRTIPATDDPTTPTTPAASTAAALVIHPRGHVAYVSNRGPDTIAVLDLATGADPATDDPAVVPTFRTVVPSGGRTPRDLLVHPSGQHLVVANQDGDRVTVLGLDEDDVPSVPVDEHVVTAPAGLVAVGSTS